MKFRLVGTTVPAVEVYFEQAGEEMITQSGGMSWMSDGISMTSDTNGGFMSGLGRMFAGESLFMARYRAQQAGTTIAFASTVPGSIIPIKMKDHPNGLICQKGAFLCSQSTVNLEVAFSRKSVVFLTPMIWLEEENPEAKPPPFEFWINTIKINSIEAIRIKIEINTYILVLFFSVNNQLFQKSNLVCKVNIFFWIFQT